MESVLRMRHASQAYNDDRGYDLITLHNGEKSVVFTIRKNFELIDGETLFGVCNLNQGVVSVGEIGSRQR